MPTKGQKFLTEYIRPHLDCRTFGERLKWKDRENEVFQLIWKHKGASGWSEEEAQVFIGWDKRKSRYNPAEKDYYTRSKQRFRAVLNKHCSGMHVTEIVSSDKSLKIYCMGDGSSLPKKYKISANMFRRRKSQENSVRLEPDAFRGDLSLLDLLDTKKEESPYSTEDTKSFTSEDSSDSYLDAVDPRLTISPFESQEPFPEINNFLDGNCDDSVVPKTEDVYDQKISTTYVNIFVDGNSGREKNEPGDIKDSSYFLSDNFPGIERPLDHDLGWLNENIMDQEKLLGW